MGRGLAYPASQAGLRLDEYEGAGQASACTGVGPRAAGNCLLGAEGFPGPLNVPHIPLRPCLPLHPKAVIFLPKCFRSCNAEAFSKLQVTLLAW